MIETVLKWSESRRSLLVLLCLSALFKTLLMMALSDETINYDGVYYISAAQQFAAGNFREAMAIYPMPLYPLLIALVYVVVGHWVLAAKLISLVCLVLALVPLYLLAEKLFDRKAAFWGCLAFVLAPMINGWTTLAIRGPCYVFFFAWSVLFALYGFCSKRFVFFAAATGFSWLSILLRIEGVVFIPVYLFFLVYMAVRQPRDRLVFLKGLLIWVGICFFLFGLLLATAGPELFSYNRIDQVLEKLLDFSKVEFMSNYSRIYQHLKELEGAAAFPVGRQNFAEIARHFMLVIYLLGLLQTLIKVIFPGNLIPLLWRAKRSFGRAHAFVAVLLASYLLMLYYFLIEQDFVDRRFLFAPAFLLFPWIGAGLKEMHACLKQIAHRKLFATLFAVFFILAPAFKCAQLFQRQDNFAVVRTAGVWLSKIPEFDKAKILSNDVRLPYYAGGESSKFRNAFYLHFYDTYGDYSSIEKVALANRIDLIAIVIRANLQSLVPAMPAYKMLKKFQGNKRVVMLYCSTRFSDQCPSADALSGQRPGDLRL